jgi:hypothetical protein
MLVVPRIVQSYYQEHSNWLCVLERHISSCQELPWYSYYLSSRVWFYQQCPQDGRRQLPNQFGPIRSQWYWCHLATYFQARWLFWGFASYFLFNVCLQDYKPMGSDKIYTGMNISGFYVLSHSIPLWVSFYLVRAFVRTYMRWYAFSVHFYAHMCICMHISN